MDSGAIHIEPYRREDFALLAGFAGAIQEHERKAVAELRPGADIGDEYASSLLNSAAEKRGAIMMARAAEETVGFVCFWIEREEDPLLRDEARDHGYVSEIFVTAEWRGQGIAQALLEEAETSLRDRGCRRVRVCSKATNLHAVRLYEAAGYRPYEIVFSKTIGTS